MNRGKKVEVICACGCGQKFMARVVDRKRGWGKFSSKSCKARWQERRTHQYKSYMNRQNDGNDYGEPPFDNTQHQNSGD